MKPTRSLLAAVGLLGLAAMLVPGRASSLEFDARLKNPRKISTGKFEDFGPQFSPDGTKLVFFSTRSGNLDIWLTDLKTGGLKQLSNDPGEDRDPSFSPDGQKIVWSSNRGGSFDIWIMNLDGSGARNLTDTKNADEFDPIFSRKRFKLFSEEPACEGPIRRELYSYYRILFTRTEKGRSRVWSMWEDGRYATALSPEDKKCKNGNWSPGNEEIIYQCQDKDRSYWERAKASLPAERKEAEWDGLPKNIDEAIKKIPTHFMVYNRIADSDPSLDLSQSVFSANKTMIMATGHKGDTKYLVASLVDGSGLSTLSKEKLNASSAVWSPDGKEITFTVIERGKSRIYIADSGFPLSDVLNLYLFPEVYKPGLNDLLIKNGFVAAASDWKEFHHLLETNRYRERPNFISVDTSLQLYHDFYEHSLEKIERGILEPALDDFIYISLNGLEDKFLKSSGPDKEIYRKLMRYFAVAFILLRSDVSPGEGEEWEGGGQGGKSDEGLSRIISSPPGSYLDLKKIDPQIDSYVMKELNLVSQHSFMDIEKQIDYTQFKIRGHYDKPGLRGYFLAMTWFHQTWLPLNDRSVYLFNSLIQDASIAGQYYKLYEIASLFVGERDDIGPMEIRKLKAVQPDLFKDPSFPQNNVNAIAEKLGKDFRPRIADVDIANFFLQSDPQAGHKLKFRVFPQRFTFDALVLQSFSSPSYPNRSYPTALDVMATFGSDRAAELAIATRSDDPKTYKSVLSGMRAEYTKATKPGSFSNLYTGWLDIIAGLIKPLAEQFTGPVPDFVKSPAWNDKTIFTTLASYTDLKHDTILYAKQPYAAECGGPPFISLVEQIEWEMPKGYVEPNHKLYFAILAQLNTLAKICQEQRLELSGAKSFSDFLQTLTRISEKELAGKTLSEEDYKFMYNSGGIIEQIYDEMAWIYEGGGGQGEKVNDEKRTELGIALVADVFTNALPSGGSPQVLELAVGRVFTIYVVVPREGRNYLTEGPIFSFYEFTQPVSNRLDDISWNELIKRRQQPGLPKWSASFIDPKLTPEK